MKDQHLQSGAYVLNALSAAESDEMDAAMAASEDLRSEVAELTDTAVLLGLAVTPVEPSADLRARLLAQVAETPQLAPLPKADDAALDDSASHEEPSGRVLAGALSWFRRPVFVAAVAAAAAVLFVSGVAVDQAVQPTTSQQASAFSSLKASPDTKTVSRAIDSGGTAKLIWSKSEQRAAIEMTGTGPLPSGKVMQLWRMDPSGTIVSAGLYRPKDGEDFQLVTVPIDQDDRFAVSVEPAGGSAQPTTAPVVVLSVGA